MDQMSGRHYTRSFACQHRKVESSGKLTGDSRGIQQFCFLVPFVIFKDFHELIQQQVIGRCPSGYDNPLVPWIDASNVFLFPNAIMISLPSTVVLSHAGQIVRGKKALANFHAIIIGIQ